MYSLSRYYLIQFRDLNLCFKVIYQLFLDVIDSKYDIPSLSMNIVNLVN